MSTLAVHRINATLTKLFTGKIDMKDCTDKKPEEQRNVFLSRSLGAYALAHLAEVDIDAAAKCVVDGLKDNGIDALYFDTTDRLLYVVQSKWMASGTGSPARGDVQKFIKGFQDLVNARFGRFNDKINKRKSEITRALDDTNVKFVLVLVYTGHNPLSDDAQSDLMDVLQEENDPVETVSLRVLTQKDLIWAVTGEANGDPISLEVMLHDWGVKRDPYLSYYGQISAEDIAGWYEKYQSRLFSKNLRQFKSKTDVNQGLERTLRTEPEHFWYFNNGITVLCADIKKKRMGGAEKTSGVFVCEGASVVNGAQTVGSIHQAYKAAPDMVKRATVAVRFISVENCPDNFVTEVTRATNTQNRIERRDFAALDPEQARLKADLWAINKEYVYKSGEAPPSVDKGFTIDDATVALACAHSDVGLSVQAKREIGKLWEDITKAPYRLVFNSGVSGLRVWRYVEVMRVVDGLLAQREKGLEGRDRMVAVHGNLMVAHLVFRRLPVKDFDEEDLDLNTVKTAAKIEAEAALKQLTEAVVQHVPPTAYLNSFFKNATKCKSLIKQIEVQEAEAKTAPGKMPAAKSRRRSAAGGGSTTSSAKSQASTVKTKAKTSTTKRTTKKG